MLDFSWSELALVGIVAVVVMKPEDIPAAMRTLGRLTRRVHYLKFALSQQFEDLMKETDLEELKRLHDARAMLGIDASGQPVTDEAAADRDIMRPMPKAAAAAATQLSEPPTAAEEDDDVRPDIDPAVTRH